MNDCVLSYTITSTGPKQLIHSLGVVPVKITSRMGARYSFTENAPLASEGTTDLTRVKCWVSAPGVSKNWPYAGEPNYLFVGYSPTGTKVISGTFVSVDANFLNLNVDFATVGAVNYQVTFDYEG